MELSEQVLKTLAELGKVTKQMKTRPSLEPSSYRTEIDILYCWYESEVRPVLKSVKSPTVQNALNEFESIYTQSRRG